LKKRGISDLYTTLRDFETAPVKKEGGTAGD